MNVPSPTNRYRHAIAALGFALAFSVVFAFSFTPLRSSHDEWWHLKTGQYLSEHGLPENDVFAYTSTSVPWHNHEWLTQLAMWKVYAAAEAAGWGGVRGVIAFKTFLIVLAFGVLGLWLSRPMRWPVAAALAVAIMAALARRTFYPRPPFVTYLMMAILISIMTAWRAGRLRGRWLALLPPLFALWSNLHGGWLAGLVIGGAFWLDAAWETGLAKFLNEDVRTPARRWSALTLAGLASAAATMLNPYGYELWLLAGRVMDDPYLMASIGELLPPDLHFVWVLPGTVTMFAAAAIRPVSRRGLLAAIPAVALVGAAFWFAPSPWIQTAIAVAALAGAVARVRPAGWLAHFVMGAFFLQQGICHVRHLSLAGLVLMPMAAWSLEDWAAAWRARRKAAAHLKDPSSAEFFATVTERRASLAMFAVLAALTAFWWTGGRERPTYLQRVKMLASGAGIQPIAVEAGGSGSYVMIPAYPVAAVNFMLNAKLPGPIFNGGNYAGYLIWKLSPKHFKVFTDNRYDIYGGRFIRQEHAVMDAHNAQYPALLKDRAPDSFAQYICRRYDWDGTALAVPEMTAPQIDAALKTPEGRRDLGFFEWRDVLDHWGIQTLAVPPGAYINRVLEKPDGWTRVYQDYQLALWVRNVPENSGIIERAKTMGAPGILR